jgi:hypothetical protein
MSYPEYHGTQEALDEFLTVGIDLAVKVAHQRRVSRLQREETARAQGRDTWRAERAKQDLDRATASAKWAAVEHDEWWEKASASQIVDAYAAAKSYESEDPTAASATETMNTEIRDRFGIDVEQLERSDTPAEDAEQLYAEHLARSRTSTSFVSGPEGVEASVAADPGRGEMLEKFRDYFLSRAVVGVSSVGSIEDVAAMSPTEGQPQARPARGMPGQGLERDRGR